LTARRKLRRFKVTGAGPSLALATLTVMVSVRVFAFSEATCPPPCNRMVMLVPGRVTFDVRRLERVDQSRGRGCVVVCKRCGSYCEIVQYRSAA
jgi:hypothetical protein